MRENESLDENRYIRQLIELDKRSLPPDGGPQFNRLIFSSSPYLLQHAENPVDWYPWGEDAFARARAEDKPIFLSIGYATCHWCHVMAHESFADDEVAAAFNRSFVCIKVDREERPDIDDQYMTVAQLLTGSGGWPLNVFMTPDKRPFHVATYLPRRAQRGLPGIIAYLDRVAELWRTERDKLEASTADILSALHGASQPQSGELPQRTLEDQAYQELAALYDHEWGGFGTATKFPMPLYLSFLLRYGRQSGIAAAQDMVTDLLRRLRQGGIYDQLGFGIHRYAVDRQWLVPHFEKMLYDQALVAFASLEACQASADPFYGRMAEEILTFALDELSTPEGGFCSGLDADSEGEEGVYYLWTPDEIEAALGSVEGKLCCQLFAVTAPGNFEGHNILHLPMTLADFAARVGITPQLLAADLERWRRTLLALRQQRIRPFRDEKVLTAWNGLMIAALARGSAVTGEQRWLIAAVRAAGFVREHLTTPAGRLLRSFHHGVAAVPAFLEDHACLLWGLIELHQATLNPLWLQQALSLADAMLTLFASDGGGLYDTGADAEQLPLRRLNAYDGIFPSGNSLAAFALFRLGRIADEPRWLQAGEDVVRAFMGTIKRQPRASLLMLAAAGYHRDPETIVTLVGARERLGELLHTVHQSYLPGLALRYGGDGSGAFSAMDGQPTAYVCAGGSCRPPVTDANVLGKLLDEVG